MPEVIKVDSPEQAVVRPYISANSLFHLVNKLDYLEEIIEKRAFIPRYCCENIEYLNVEIDDVIVKNVAYPEKCFCDIPLHELLAHKTTYGDFGIGLSKKWGERNGLQPIQYINPCSPLAEDFREAFMTSINTDANQYIDTIGSYLQTHMFYIKPIKGENVSRMSNEVENKYLTDECEWRFIPKLHDRLPYVLSDHEISRNNGKGKKIIEVYNETLKTEEYSDTWLRFEYDEVKYLLVKNSGLRERLVRFIDKSLKVTEMEKMILISKIIILDDALEDF